MSVLKKAANRAMSVWHFLRIQRLRLGSLEDRFTSVYTDGVWGDGESASGVGSNMAHTEVVRRELGPLIERLGVKSMLDVPCGDFNWMRTLELPLESYIGGDIVAELVEANESKYGREGRSFIHCDVTSDPLPKVDLILCRDLLGHLSLKHGRAALANMRTSGSQWLLTTTHNKLESNWDLPSGGAYRPLNLEKAPFNLPAPTELIEEPFPGGPGLDKCLGLWKIDVLPDSDT
jgi:hypothetical protein